jgi:hypothetical protein
MAKQLCLSCGDKFLFIWYRLSKTFSLLSFLFKKWIFTKNMETSSTLFLIPYFLGFSKLFSLFWFLFKNWTLNLVFLCAKKFLSYCYQLSKLFSSFSKTRTFIVDSKTTYFFMRWLVLIYLISVIKTVQFLSVCFLFKNWGVQFFSKLT